MLGIIIIVATFMLFNLLIRVRKCERALEELKTFIKVGNNEPKPKTIKQSNDSFVSSPSKPIANPIIKKKEEILKPARRSTIKTLEQIPKKPSVILDMIKENWMGIFGSVALVIGAVFFGLTAEIMQLPQMRVGVMMAISFVLLAVSQKFKNKADWASFCGWVKSIAAAVILFTTLGAGGINGIQFIYTPLYALCFLCFGILINILLVVTARSEGIASLHVVLSIIAFSIAPQTFISLPIGAFVAGVGLTVAYRSKWDTHLILVVIAFACQNMVWTFALKDQFLPWMHYLAIGSSVFVGLMAAFVHYNKKYQASKFEVLPLVAYLTNWGLLTWNIWLHTFYFKWIFLVFGAVAVLGFVSARIAKRRKIYWLYYADILLSQLMLMVAIALMSSLIAKPIDLALLILCEIIVFNLICQLQNERALLRVGYALQCIAYVVIASFTLKLLFVTPVVDQFPIYYRMGIVAALSWGSHIMGSLKNFIPDNIIFILYGERDQKNLVSIVCSFGTLFFIGIYFYGYNSIWIQAITLTIIGLISLWRKYKESHSWNVSFLIVLIAIHSLSWYHLVFQLQNSSIPSMFSRIDLLGLLFLDVLLVFGNCLHLKLWKKNLHHFVIYASGIQMGLLVYVFTKEISSLIPGLAFLGISMFALEVAHILSRVNRFREDVRLKIKESTTHLGLAFLLAFITQFVTVHLQVDAIWHGISLRWGIEALGLSAILYWITFYPCEKVFSKFTQFCGNRLIEGLLAFLTLVVIVEAPEVWRPFIWIAMAIGLLIGSTKAKWPARLSAYSWIYLIASIILVAFVTKNLTMPSLFVIEQYGIPVILTIVLQWYYAYFAHKETKNLMAVSKILSTKRTTKFISIFYEQPCLTVLLPIFVGKGCLFAFNFEKAILTLLWVGLACLYLTVGLLVKSKKGIQIAMSVLLFCSVRLIVFDLVQTNLVTRSLVFIGFGILMLGISVLYKKYKYRIDASEKV